MTSKIEQYIETYITYIESNLREDDALVLEHEMDKLWASMTDNERDLLEKEIDDIIDSKIKGKP